MFVLLKAWLIAFNPIFKKMKTLLLSTFLILLAFGLSAQIVLTYSDNALIAGDSFSFQEIQFTDPGNSGPNQIWDFSKIQLTGKNPVSAIQTPAVPKMDGAGDYNLSLVENGYEYFMNSLESGLEEHGYSNTDLKLTLKYSDPVVKIKYPFTYGTQFTDHFIGIAYYSETNTIDFFGDNAVSGDAFGTLILPDRVIDNALRVKSVKTGLQVNMCGTTNISIAKYNWYATGYRYPVASISIVENTPGVGAAQIIKTAYLTTQLPLKNSPAVPANLASSATDPNKAMTKPEVSVNILPNPFTDQLTYNYFLNEQMSVSVELYNISGKNMAWIVKDQQQTLGLQTGEVIASRYGLTPGVYFLRFTFDKQIVISKIVKI